MKSTSPNRLTITVLLARILVASACIINPLLAPLSAHESASSEIIGKTTGELYSHATSLGAADQDNPREDAQLHTTLLKRLEQEDKEFEEYRQLEASIGNSELSEIQEKIANFKQKYLLSAYQNSFIALEKYLRYKKSPMKQETSETHIEQFTLSKDIEAYHIYLQALTIKELADHQDSSILQQVCPPLRFLSAPKYTINHNFSLMAAQAFRTLLEKYPSSPYSRDAEQRLFELESRGSLIILENAIDSYNNQNNLDAIGKINLLLSKYPYKREAVQGMYLASLAYNALGLDSLAERYKQCFMANRYQLVPLWEKPNLFKWFDIAQTTTYSLPTETDQRAYQIVKTTLNVLYRNHRHLKSRGSGQTKSSFMSIESKESKEIGELIESIKRLIQLALEYESNLIAGVGVKDPKIVQMIESQFDQVTALGNEISKLGYRAVLEFDYATYSEKLNHSIDHIQKAL